MAKQVVQIPDGEFCCDKTHLGCLYEQHENGFHHCLLFGTDIGSLEEFTVNGERQRAFRKCEACRQNMKSDTSNGIITDDMKKAREEMARDNAFTYKERRDDRLSFPYPLNMFAEVFRVTSHEELTQFPTQMGTKHNYLMRSITSKKEQIILQSRYKEKLTRQEISEVHGISDGYHTIETLSWRLKEIYPFAKRIMMSMEDLRPKGMPIPEWNYWRECAIRATQHVAARTPLKKIPDLCDRLDVILCRSHFKLIDLLELPAQRNIRTRNSIHYIWELSLLTPEELRCLHNVGERTASEIETWLKEHDLYLWGADDENQVAADKAELCEAKKRGPDGDLGKRVFSALAYHEFLLRARLSL